MRPQFSILILTHNRPDAVARCFASLRMTQTRDDVECLALDNGSAPDVLRLLKAEPGITRLIAWQKCRGVTAGREALMEMARGRVLVFLDVNAVIEDSLWLDRLAAALKRESVGIAGPEGWFIRPGWQDAFPAPPGPCDVLSGGCLALKRELRPEIDPAENDAELCLQVRRAGWDVCCTGPIGVRHGGHVGDCDDLRRRWQGKGLIRAECGYEDPSSPVPFSHCAGEGEPVPLAHEAGEGVGGEGILEEVQAWHARAWQI
jgi:glycosyltransferase involved in cell wall biosynthesis